MIIFCLLCLFCLLLATSSSSLPRFFFFFLVPNELCFDELIYEFQIMIVCVALFFFYLSFDFRCFASIGDWPFSFFFFLSFVFVAIIPQPPEYNLYLTLATYSHVDGSKRILGMFLNTCVQKRGENWSRLCTSFFLVWFLCFFLNNLYPNFSFPSKE